MSADIVIAGAETRSRFSLAQRFPLHFRKTYFPGRLHGEPKEEFERQSDAAALIDIPPPIGYEPNVFRTCLLPGVPYDRLSPFSVDSDERNLARARSLGIACAAGLYHFVECAFASMQRLHEGGLVHGDAELHNFIVCPSPLEIVMIDFEVAYRIDDAEVRDEARVQADFTPMLREAVFLQCALGPQPGPLADMAKERLPSLFKDSTRLRCEISDHETPAV
jgi:serine/threonine protein kinase